MSLEDQQFQHDQFQANKSNISASNDPAQIKHDANEMLIRGAQVLLEGRQAGLSDEETMDYHLRRFGQR